MANRKRGGIFGIGTFIIGLLALAVFNETVASFLDETRLNRGWTLIGPALAWAAGLIRLLGHPVMTHIYAFVVGAFVSLVVLFATAIARGSPPPKASLISLRELVHYLINETEWAKKHPSITDTMVQFELLDVLTSGRLNAFARLTKFGHPSGLKRVHQDYFDAVLIDMNAIRNQSAGQISIKPGYTGDHFEHWQFMESEVKDLWPRFKPPRKKLFGKVFGS